MPVPRSLPVYRTLLRLYPKPHRDRYSAEMEQTFADLHRDGTSVVWIFAETSVSIARERGRHAMTGTTTIGVYRLVKNLALAACVLLVAAIGTVMLLARGTGEDMTGVVAPAVLLVVLSSITAVVAAVLQRRAGRPAA